MFHSYETSSFFAPVFGYSFLICFGGHTTIGRAIAIMVDHCLSLVVTLSCFQGSKSTHNDILMKHLLTVLFFGLSVLFLQAQSLITPEMIADTRTVRQTVLSPDGQTVAYSFHIPGDADTKPGKAWYEIHTIGVDGQNHRKYVSKPNSGFSLSWSPDGKYIYFLGYRKSDDAHTQVYRIPVDGGEAERVTGHETTVGRYQISPDGKWIAYTARDAKTRQEKLDAATGKDWIVYGQDYKYTRLYVTEIGTSSSKQVFEENLEVSSVSWSPDGKTIVFKAAEIPETDYNYMFQKIYRVSAQGGTPAIVCSTAGKLGHLEVSPDGKTLAFAGAVDITDPLPQSLFTVPLLGGKPQNHTQDMEASVTGFSWQDNSNILLHVAEGCYYSLYQLSIAKGKRKLLFGQGEIFSSFSYHSSTGNIAVPGSSPAHPREVLTGNIDKLKFKRLTHSNPELESLKLGRQEVVTWKSSDGMEIEGVVTYPPNYKEGSSYPLLLQIHGGPEGISTNGWNTRSVYPIQLYAASGFVVLEPNYRGSNGRGVAFAKADHKDLAGKEYEDVITGVDALVTKGIADRDKVGTGGFSYGGYFSAWGATKYSDRFKASMVGAGITNWISFSGTTDIIYENSLVHWNLWWYDEMDLVWDRSPLAHINKAQTPTLIVHGEKDLRVPIGQGQELYHALKLRNIPTEMVVYRRQPHGIRERAAQIDYMNRTLRWYMEYIL